ncbi:PREDICTED: protein disulfide-isomerase A4-like [Priapulus caudatus]|uniref:Protein disulfide-isomerase n=1 Tax=Priapulus caudatus TaxID=37621 RepID=A0ABM1E660_PRICU|nr:PREDICTED: protein disulfide-isomerase A4-like [Priapulus caudatus]
MSKDAILVEFYAPWCGHCKQLAPEYEKAAARLKANTPPIPLAKVDGTVEEELAKKYEVTGYPTLKFFKNGEAIDYTGDRKADGIVKWMKERSDPNWTAPVSAVLVLTSENFTQVVTEADIILVEFYAPWCGHCKKLAPEYEVAAQVLKDQHDPPIPFAKVDTTVEEDIGIEYEVTGYPTLKIFRKGKPHDYKGPRTAKDMVYYMAAQAGFSSHLLNTTKDVHEYMLHDDITIIGFFSGPSEHLFTTYLEAGNDLRDDYRFGHTFNHEVAQHYKAEPETIVLFYPEHMHSSYEPHRHVFRENDAVPENIASFYERFNLPLVGHRNKEMEQRRYNKRRPLCVVYFTVDFGFDYRDDTQFWRGKVLQVANDFRDITFAISDEDEFKDELKDLGLEDSGQDVNAACWDQSGKRYVLDPEEDFEEDVFREFVEKFHNDKLTAHVKSQPVPKRNDGPVKIVVGKNFDEIVGDNHKDVLIEFYAPWCGHCKALEPEFNKLGKKLKNKTSITIAKLDATANDFPTAIYDVTGYPTIYFAPANNKKAPIKYTGKRDFKGLVKFIEKEATISLKEKDEL